LAVEFVIPAALRYPSSSPENRAQPRHFRQESGLVWNLLLIPEGWLRGESSLGNLMQCRMITLLLLAAAATCISAQNQPAAVPASSLSADYPLDRVGILIKDQQWSPVANQVPVKTR